MWELSVDVGQGKGNGSQIGEDMVKTAGRGVVSSSLRSPTEFLSRKVTLQAPPLSPTYNFWPAVSVCASWQVCRVPRLYGALVLPGTSLEAWRNDSSSI